MTKPPAAIITKHRYAFAEPDYDPRTNDDWWFDEDGNQTRDAIINAAQRLPDQNRYLFNLQQVTGKTIPWDATAEQHLDSYLLSLP